MKQKATDFDPHVLGEPWHPIKEQQNTLTDNMYEIANSFEIDGVSVYVISELPAEKKIYALRRGFSTQQAETVRLNLGLNQQSFFTSIGISPRHAARLVKEEKHLDLASSERLLRLVDVEQHAAEAFGNKELAIEWMKKKNAILGCAPVDLLDTEIGHQEVKRILTAIEYGISV